MSSYKLALGHIGDEARVISCFFIDCLLLLFYVLVVGHNSMVGVVVTIILVFRFNHLLSLYSFGVMPTSRLKNLLKKAGFGKLRSYAIAATCRSV